MKNVKGTKVHIASFAWYSVYARDIPKLNFYGLIITLNMRRKKAPLMEEVKYHCPHEECLYSVGSERFFTKKFNLKQHLLKVHTEKSFQCSKCHNKTFATDKLLAYHEKNCGISWKCSCGLSYDMRETLLTHVRRTAHKLPENIKPPKRKLENPSKSVQFECTSNRIHVIPVKVILSSPVQTDPSFFTVVNSSAAKSAVQAAKQFRKILPKPKKGLINGLKNYFTNPDPVIYKVENMTQTDKEFSSQNETANKNKKITKSTSVETQTSRRSIFRKMHKIVSQVESRGSQCYPGQKSRRRSVRLESNETQTTEIILDKMKQVLRSNSNKKGFNKPSLVDESSSTSNLRVDVSAQSVLSCLDLLLNSRFAMTNRPQCSSGTQTSPRCKRARELRDTETGTDKSDENDFGMLSLLATVCQSLASEVISQSKSTKKYSSDKDTCSSTDSQDVSKVFKPIESKGKQNGIVSSLEETNLVASCSFPTLRINTDRVTTSSAQPMLLDIETQTSDENICNFLSNMETQTTVEDDFLFPDLELSDIQTQTPWTDFIDFYNNLDEGQLSAEIQTDITSNDLANTLDSSWGEEMCPPSSDANVAHIETQTQLDSSSPMLQFTSSYTQTLEDICDFFAIEEKIDLS